MEQSLAPEVGLPATLTGLRLFTFILHGSGRHNMASSDSLALRSKYLQEAAHLLAVSSPSASASLGEARYRIIESNELPAKELDAFRRETCGACGSLLVPGRSCRVEIKPQVHRTQDKSIPRKECISASNAVYTCLRCNRSTSQALQPKPRRLLKKHAGRPNTAPTDAQKQSGQEDDHQVTRSTKSTSKQRQKARRGGLQAMLEKTKAQSSAQGFDLMDFAM
jgi:RNase P subunit RPR2